MTTEPRLPWDCHVCGRNPCVCKHTVPATLPSNPMSPQQDSFLRLWQNYCDLKEEVAQLRSTNENLRATLADPPGDVQELVLRKLGLWPPPAPETGANLNAECPGCGQRYEAIKGHVCPAVKTRDDGLCWIKGCQRLKGHEGFCDPLPAPDVKGDA